MGLPRLGIRSAIASSIRPIPPRDSFTFLSKRLRTPQGKPFNVHDYPWVKGICEAFDNPEVRIVAMQMAARIGKSMTAQGLMVSALNHAPDIGMVAQSTSTLLEQTIEDKYYPILENTNETRKLIPPAHRRNKKEVSFNGVKVYGAWSGSTTTLSDKPPKYKHAGEVDKWDVAKSREADSLKLFMQRGIEIPDRKSIIESTPDLKHTSRIEKYLLAGWNARFLIPCPKCLKHIQLIPGDGKERGGVVFDKLKGVVNPLQAYKTSRYLCQACGDEWGDMHRRPAILQGVWCPEGCEVERYGRKKAKVKIVGEMTGDPEIASFQLSRIYAPTFKFGDIGRQIAKCVVDPDEWQDTNNSWFGITYAHRKAEFTWEETAARLSTIDYKLGIVPHGGIFLTCGIDVQEDKFVYVVCAWGRYGVGWIVDYGNAWTEQDLKSVLAQRYDHQDGGPKLPISISLIDSGEGRRQDEIFDIARNLNKSKGPWVWPSKGSKSALQGGKSHKKQQFEKMEDKRKLYGRLHGLLGFFHITVNTPSTQTWVDKALFHKKPGDPKSIAIPRDCTEDEDFISQLINEKREGVDSTDGHGSHRWVVVDETIPWDFRDSLRYSRVGADIFTNSQWIRIATKRRIETKKPTRKTKAKTRQSRKKPTKKSSKQFVRSSAASKFIRS